MNKRLIGGIWLIALLALVTQSFASVNVNVVFPFGNAQLIYVSDLDLLRTGQGRELFRVTVTNINSTAAELATARLKVTLFNGTNDQIAAGSIPLANYGPVGGPWVLTNLNISTGTGGTWEGSDSLRNSYRDQLLRTGMIPSDQYRFHYEVINTSNSVMGFFDYYLTLRGMGYVSLRYPDNDVNGEAPLQSNLPFFVWASSQSSFSIKIGEIVGDESPDAALESHVVCEASGLATNFFQYPTAGAIQLEAGKRYAWRVTTTVVTSSGSVPVASEVRVFKIASTISPNARQIMEALNLMLNTPQGQNTLNAIRSGQLTGVVYLNGQPIAPSQLMAMLGEFLNGRYRIISLRVD